MMSRLALRLPREVVPPANNKFSVEENRGLNLGVSFKSPRQPIVNLEYSRYTLTKAFPILEPDAHIPLPETPKTPSSVRSSACYGLTSVSVSTTPDSSPIYTPSFGSQRRTNPSSPAPSNNSNNNSNSDNKSRHNCPPHLAPRSRRTCSSVASRSHPELHAARLERSATLSASNSTPARKDSVKEHKSRNPQRRSLSSNTSADSTPEHSAANLTKMDDKWIIVQQKTFTKWLVVSLACGSAIASLRQCFSPS
jgi:hypothetical protein